MAAEKRMKTASLIAAGALLAGALSSCATVFNHKAQDVALAPQIKGQAPAATGPIRVLITSNLGTYQATLPTHFVITADMWAHVRVKVVEPCYQQSETALPRSITWWYWADVVGGAIGGGLGAIFPFVGDGFDGTAWSYDEDVKIAVEPMNNFTACADEARKRPGVPFPAGPDPIWRDPRIYPIAAQGGAPATYPTLR